MLVADFLTIRREVPHHTRRVGAGMKAATDVGTQSVKSVSLGSQYTV